MSTPRELTREEQEKVTAGTGVVLGNPGNFKPVGQAGEDPSNNPPTDFVTGGSHIGGNGAFGASTN